MGDTDNAITEQATRLVQTAQQLAAAGPYSAEACLAMLHESVGLLARATAAEERAGQAEADRARDQQLLREPREG